MPYLYSTFYESTQNGMPIMRTLAIENTFDPKVYDMRFQNQYFFGGSFMIAPFEGNKEYGNIYFPKETWYDLYTDEVFEANKEQVRPISMEKLPIFIKSGSIIPMQSLVQSTAEMPVDTLDIHIYKGSKINSFNYYEDDGKSFDYENGTYYLRTITYDPLHRNVVFAKPEGTFKSKFNTLRLIFHGFGDESNFGDERFLKEQFSFLSPISKFDPIGGNGRNEALNVKSKIVPNSSNAFNVKF
jgi:alpha-glucosidase